MNMRLAILLLPVLSACLVVPPEDDPASCDLDTFFSETEQNVNCVEKEAGSGEFECTCPDGTTFASSDTCSKSDQDQGELIDSACPVEEN